MTAVNYRELSPFQQRQLWEQCKAGDENGRRKLLELNYPLVQAVVSRFDFAPHRREDLFQGGVVGLLCAMDRFDPQRGVPFGVYAFPFIKGEVLKCLAEMKGEKPREYRKYTEVVSAEGSLKDALTAVSISLEEWLEVGETLRFADERAEEMFRAVEDRLSLETAASVLTDEEKQLLYCRYYLKKSQAETGAELSLSQARISRKEREILEKLRGSM